MPHFYFLGYSFEAILIVASFLLIISVVASRISSRFGVPALLLFLGIGMLAGSEGAGQIEFDNYPLAFAIGSICLALIIFDGGARTSWRSIRPILPLGISLSVLGTVVTGLLTAVFAHYALGLEWFGSLLLGAIVSSTDAAAVFSILRARNLSLRGSLKQTLEFEAGSNDPVAVLLTVGVLLVAASEGNGLVEIIELFALQAGLGLAFGFGGGWIARGLNNHAGIEYEGLYGVLQVGLVIGLFSLTSSIGGSGFLAVYIAGLFLGNSELLHKGSIIRFFDGIAWLAQILVFLTLGLLVFPSKLLPLWKEGLALALFMMFVARPVSVFLASLGRSMPRSDRLFVSWVGLRGAAPIILATLPWSVGLPNAEYYFNLVFFVVLLSVIFQGITIPWAANFFGVTEPLKGTLAEAGTPGLLPEGFITVEIDVLEKAAAENQKIVDMGLPPGVLLTNLKRNERFLVPRGDTQIQKGDRIWALARSSNVDTLKALFGTARPSS